MSEPDLSTATAQSESSSPESGFAEVGHPRRRAILLVLSLSLLVVVIDNTVLNTALPTLARSLHAGTSSLQWIVDAYTLCFAALLIPAGALGDRFGRRRALIGGLVLFALGSLAAAFAPNTATLIGDRVLMGLGGAFVMPSTLSILNSVFPPSERPQAIAAWSAVAGAGIAIGPTLGGGLLSHFWWGSVFLVNLPLVALALVGVVRIVPESADEDAHRLDLVGTVLVALGLVALVDAIIEAPGRGWTAPMTILEVAVAVVVLTGFVRWELWTEHPLIDLRVFSSRSFSAAAGAVTVIFFSLFGSLFVLTQYLQLVHGYSPLAAGIRALPFAGAMIVVSPVSTSLARRLGSRAVIAGGLLLMAGGLFVLSLVGVSTPYSSLALFIAMMGAGMGLVMAPASTTIMGSVAAGQAGAGSAINDTIREVGGALGVAVIGSLAGALYSHKLRPELAAHHAPLAVIHIATGSVAAADAVGRHIGGSRGSALVGAAHQAFVSGMAGGMRVAAGVAVAGALAALLALPSRRTGGLAAMEMPSYAEPAAELVA